MLLIVVTARGGRPPLLNNTTIAYNTIRVESASQSVCLLVCRLQPYSIPHVVCMNREKSVQVFGRLVQYLSYTSAWVVVSIVNACMSLDPSWMCHFLSGRAVFFSANVDSDHMYVSTTSTTMMPPRRRDPPLLLPGDHLTARSSKESESVI